jgi:hypothetical protein
MRIANALVTLCMAVMLAGCVSSRSETVRAMPAELMKTGKVANITVKSVPANTSASFAGTMQTQLRESLDQCATGSEPLDLEVAITDFKSSDPAKAILIGDSNNIKGTARLLRSGETVADFDISRSVGAGGIAGAIIMSNAEGNTAIGFATEVCERAFGRRPSPSRR